MIKNGFLQQNAFDDIDAYSVPEKQLDILLLIMDFYAHSLNLVKSGCPLLKISEMPVRNEIVRAKSNVPNDKLDQLKTIRLHLDDQVAELSRMYRREAL